MYLETWTTNQTDCSALLFIVVSKYQTLPTLTLLQHPYNTCWTMLSQCPIKIVNSQLKHAPKTTLALGRQQNKT